MSSIDEALREARHRLLDLTLRNRLLNHRPSRKRSISVVDELPGEVFQRLVLDERAMWFRAAPESAAEPAAGGLAPDPLWADSPAVGPDDPVTDIGPAPRHVDRFLQTPLAEEALQQRLFYIHQQAATVLEEQGYTALFLALGFLEWRDRREPETVRRAPLIVVPVDLERNRVKSAFKLWWTKEDVETNISLRAKLEDERVALPEFESPESGDGIDAYLDSVRDAIADHAAWRVVPEIHLDFFSFTKFVMHRDLEPTTWPPEVAPTAHPLLMQVLAAGDASARETSTTSAAERFDAGQVDRLDPAKSFSVLDADPSQIAVIQDVLAGANLVVEGPPGTGKSQTIANLIAELLAAGRTVLFVSEKMAALDVVKRRLDRCGAGDFCLELHSRKSRKRDVLESLSQTLAVEAPPGRDPENRFERLRGLREQLDDYARALRDPIGRTGRTPFELLAERARARATGAEVARIELGDVARSTERDLERARVGVEEVAAVAKPLHPVREHPWRGTRPGLVMPAEEGELRDAAAVLAREAESVRHESERLAESTALPPAADPIALRRSFEGVELLASPPTGVHVAQICRETWDPEKVSELLSLASDLSRQYDALASRCVPEIFDVDAEALRSRIHRYRQRPFRVLFPGFRAVRREMTALYRVRPTKTTVEWLVDLDKVSSFNRTRAEVAEQSEIGAALLGDAWNADPIDLDSLRVAAGWIERVREGLAEGWIGVAAVERAFGDQPPNYELGPVQRALDAFENQREIVVERVHLGAEAAFGVPLGSVSFAAMRDRASGWRDGITAIQEWTRFDDARAELRDPAAARFVAAIGELDVAPPRWRDVFDTNIADALLDAAFRERSSLGGFAGSMYEQRVEAFAKLDVDLIDQNQGRLVRKLVDNRPTLAPGASSGSEAGVLLGEFNRKRGHRPIRQLLRIAGGLVQRIKPCFMMSPLSVARFLDPSVVRFDVVIFDEASQVRPEDALGAVLRGDQLVVMGDRRQLPPTTFFDHLGRDEDEPTDDAAGLTDVESVLHQCRRSLPVRSLQWHYRSRHESLIAVSNALFYDHRLRVFPSPFQAAAHLGVHHVHLPDARYQRGGGGGNRAEARAVAAAVLEHYRRSPERSLGVGAFNVRQQEAILEEVERALRLDPDLEPAMRDGDEPFFVKNLETIQGDERDAIFLSVGFGFDESGRLSRNFGPLNQAGGERRLNVLVTRARRRCVVFSNFTAADLRADDDSAVGLRALAVYLRFAATRDFAELAPDDDRPPSTFAETVAETLRDGGHRVGLAVGSSGFRVDVAVGDGADGDYLVAVETDGAKYHATSVARDRDRLRDTLLAGLGWEVVRVWAPEWYRAPREARAALLERVAAALARARENRVAAPDSIAAITEAASAALPTQEPEPERRPVAAARGPVDYTTCDAPGVGADFDLASASPDALAPAIVRIVDTEGPLHRLEVVRRLRDACGLKRATAKTTAAVVAAVQHASRAESLRYDDPWLWPAGVDRCPIRRRLDRAMLKLDRIPEQEFEEAARFVLAEQFATPADQLVVRMARSVGYRSVSAQLKTALTALVDRMIEAGGLRRRADGLVELAED